MRAMCVFVAFFFTVVFIGDALSGKPLSSLGTMLICWGLAIGQIRALPQTQDFQRPLGWIAVGLAVTGGVLAVTMLYQG